MIDLKEKILTVLVFLLSFVIIIVCVYTWLSLKDLELLKSENERLKLANETAAISIGHYEEANRELGKSVEEANKSLRDLEEAEATRKQEADRQINNAKLKVQQYQSIIDDLGTRLELGRSGVEGDLSELRVYYESKLKEVER